MIQERAEAAGKLLEISGKVAAELRRRGTPKEFHIFLVVYKEVRGLFSSKFEEDYRYVAGGWCISRKDEESYLDGSHCWVIKGLLLATDGRIFNFHLANGDGSSVEIEDGQTNAFVRVLKEPSSYYTENGPLDDASYHRDYDLLLTGLADLSLRHGLDPSVFE
jgi:hypothetical protein